MVKRLSPRRICFSLAVDSIFQRDRRLGDFDKRYVYMLIDDVANAIVPFQNAPNVDFRATLTTSPIEADSLVRGGFGDPARYDFDETVADFIRYSAKAVLYLGREFY